MMITDSHASRFCLVWVRKVIPTIMTADMMMVVNTEIRLISEASASSEPFT